MNDHIAAVTREAADGVLAKVWTLVCSAEERDYTSGELEEIIISCTVVSATFTKLFEVTAKTVADPVEAKRPNRVDKHRIDHGDYVRASGDAYCKVCGHVYDDHPVVVGFEWLHRVCDGRLLKL